MGTLRSFAPRPATWLVTMAVSLPLAGCSIGEPAGNPHIQHVKLPSFKTWRVTSVQPYEGLAEIELVKFDWPTAQDAHVAFALSREGLKTGDPICLDHVAEIDTFWAHPVPQGGCETLDKQLVQ